MSYIYMEKRGAGISKWGLRDKKYVLFAGELVKREGIHFLVEAFKQLEDTAKTPNNFKLVIAGKEQIDEDYVTYLRTISEGRSNIILIITGKKGYAIKRLMAQAYLFVLPSQSPGQTDMLRAAMEHSLAPLVSDIKENIELVGKAGFTFQAESITGLRDRLAYLLSRREEVKAIGRLAKKHAAKLSEESAGNQETAPADNKPLTPTKLSWIWKHFLTKNK